MRTTHAKMYNISLYCLLLAVTGITTVLWYFHWTLAVTWLSLWLFGWAYTFQLFATEAEKKAKEKKL